MTASNFEMRRGFVYKDGQLRFNPKRNMTNYDWLVNGEGMSEEEFANTVHGLVYPGRVYFYKGVDTADTDEEVEKVAQSCRDQFTKETEICCGAIPGKIGTMWEPRKTIGYGTKAGAAQEQND